MLLTDMHVWFRQYAQQMGMQNTRAILPEQIDILLNTSINDIVNQIIKENIGITNDRVITDNSKIGQINALRSLYKVKEISFKPEYKFIINNLSLIDRHIENGALLVFGVEFPTDVVLPTGGYDLEYQFEIDTNNYSKSMPVRVKEAFNKMTHLKEYVDCKVLDNDRVEFTIKNGVIKFYIHIWDIINYDTVYYTSDYKEINTQRPFEFSPKNKYSGLIKSNDKFNFPEHLFVVDFSINYSTAKVGYNNDGTKFEYDEEFVTNYYPIRLIDDAYLADTLNDFVLKNRLRSPILTIYNNNTYDLYIDKFENKGDAENPSWTLPGNLLPYTFRMSYIGKPAKVKFNEDIGQPNVECDLPDYLHIDIIKHAVDLYHIAISGNLHAAQQQQQNQQREDVRNNASN